MNIVLASASPRRRELLQRAGVEFTVRVSDAEEYIEPGTPPHEAVMQLGNVRGLSTAKVRDMVADYVFPSDDVDTGFMAVMTSH